MHPRLGHIGPITIPTFGVIAAVGLVLALLLAARCARILHLDDNKVWNLCLTVIVGTLLISRLVIIAQVPSSFIHYPLYILTLPTVTQFGFAAALISGLVFIYFARLPWLRTGDAVAPAALLFAAFIHLGSLFSGDDLGSVTTARIGNLVPGDEGHHPVALYACILTLVACAVTYAWLKRQSQSGEALGLAISLAALTRYAVDILRPSYTLPDTLAFGIVRLDQLILALATSFGIAFFLKKKEPVLASALTHQHGEQHAQ